MNDELAAQLEFFRDIGVDTLDASSIPKRPPAAFGSSPPLEGESRARSGRQGVALEQGLNPAMTLDSIRSEIGDCQRCKLAPTRTNIVFGSGNPRAELVFVGEAPGFDEDQQGLPFVGRAGQLLTKIIESINLKREDVFIANVLKCRPPENRNPEPDEVEACLPYLREQIRLIGPRIIVTLGTFATQAILETEIGIGRLRGRFHPMGSVRVMPTYHPAFLLRSPERKKDVWEDMKKVR